MLRNAEPVLCQKKTARSTIRPEEEEDDDRAESQSVSPSVSQAVTRKPLIRPACPEDTSDRDQRVGYSIRV